jgi:hypothetical protein
MVNDSARDTEIIHRYRDCGESERAVARALETTRGTVSRCLDRHEIERRPRAPVWTPEERWHLVIICNSLNNDGQYVTGQEFMKFFPEHSYSSIKHHRDMLRNKKLIR